jgi:L,D-transpeptidase ErfK/SrfK
MQWKMEQEEKPVKTIVPPGPDNPLGRYAMTTSIPGVVIHETIWPTSINRYQSHGCIRLLPEHMESFFGEGERGTRGEIIYQPVKVAVTDQGKVIVQVHRDIYGKVKDYPAEAKRMIESLGVGAKVSWPRLEQLLQEKTGRVEDVTL